MTDDTNDKPKDKSSEIASSQRHIKRKGYYKRKIAASDEFEHCATADVEEWTIAKIVDELVCEMGCSNLYTIDKKTKHICITRKYYDQAKWVLYRINVFDPIPEFVIDISDLSRRMKCELHSFCTDPIELKRIITEAISRILEAVDPKYYHVSGVHGKFRWRLAS